MVTGRRHEFDEQEGNSMDFDIIDYLVTTTKARMSCTKEVLVLWLVKDRLGDLAPLVTHYLVKPLTKVRRNYLLINHTAAASMRYDISSAAAAAVANGFLKDLIADGHIPANKAYLA